jgi:3-hydroxyacyl-[acyl-carrier-protein] dehydratase
MDRLLSEALSRLPHGKEFRFVDRLVRLDPGKTGAGEYLVRGDEPFLRGHFPAEPIMPGVLLVEAAAQLAGVVAQSDPAIPPLAGLKLAAIRAAKITGTAKPGELVKLEARITARLGGVIQASVAGFVSDQPVLRGEITLSGEEPRTVSK